MNVQVGAAHTNKTEASPCPCGCAPCEHTCCTLDCLVQPRYFCGQLLTDADLTAGLDWAKSKFRLRRFHEGWGVICGLDVRGNVKQPGAIMVAPGYALDCCGDDIIVCKEATLDLTQVIRQPANPCDTPSRQRNPVLVSAETGSPGGDLIVDVYIRYREEQAAPGLTLGRAACGQVGECEYTRTKETYQFIPQLVTSDEDPLLAEEKRWLEGYDSCLDLLRILGDRVESAEQRKQRDIEPQKDAAPYLPTLQYALKQWVAEHPLNHFMEAYEFIKASDPDAWLKEHGMEAGELLFLILQDCRNAHLTCGCASCDEDSGVLLARVWLHARTEHRRTTYSIKNIDSYPPYRRLQRRDCLPARFAYVNVGEAIWRRVENAREILARRGVRLVPGAPEIFKPSDSSTAVYKTLTEFSVLMHPVGAMLTPLVYGDDQRVVGFKAQAAS
jgi:hypothetical protein